jgi:hypothetical protein
VLVAGRNLGGDDGALVVQPPPGDPELAGDLRVPERL